MIEHFINKFMFSITRQCLNQITVAHITGSQTVAMCFHIFYQIREYFLMQICIRSVVTLFICILRHLEEQRKRTFTVTVKKITDADRTYKIAVANISGGTVTAKPNPAAAGEEVKLTIEPNDGKKLIAGSLSYCLQSAGAKSEPINETTLTFIMPAGDININAQFEDDASAPIKNPPQITAFMINGVSAVINHDTKAITIILPYGTDLKHVAPTIVTANASKVEPSSAQRVNLSTPKAYRVYASNGAYVTYTVTAYTEEPSPTQSLWEKLQNQINSNPNWWELAEYQKKTGYYK